MRVLHVVASAAIGGAERHVIDLAVMQREQGIEARVACPDGGALAAALRREGVPVHPWSAGGRRLPWTRWSLAAAIAAAHPDVLHAHMAKSAWLARRVAPRIAALATAHTLVRSQAFAGYRRVLCVSAAVRASLLATGFPETAAVLVYNAIDLQRYRPASDKAALRRSLGWPADDCVVMQVGRLEPVKGHRYALQALARLQAAACPVRLLIVGEGTERRELERYARAHALTAAVTFLGFRDDVPTLLQAADVCLMPSLKEGFGLAMVEAMACGVVPVAFAVGGIPESVTSGENGLLVGAGDVEAMAAAVQTLCWDEALRQRLAAAARQTVMRRYSRERQLAAVLEAYGFVRAAGSPAASAGGG